MTILILDSMNPSEFFTSIESLKEQLVADLLEKVSPYFYTSKASGENTQIWLPRNDQKVVTRELIELDGYRIKLFAGLNRKGVVQLDKEYVNPGMPVSVYNTVSYKNLPLEDLVKLNIWATKRFTRTIENVRGQEQTPRRLAS